MVGVDIDSNSSASKTSSNSSSRAGSGTATDGMSPPSSSAGVSVTKAVPNQSHKDSSNASKSDGKNGNTGRTGLSTPPPQAHQPYQPHYLYQQLDPNQLTGYYPYQTAMSPDPNSPSTPSNRYDLQAAFLQQQAAQGATPTPFGNTPYQTGLPQLPLSPHPSPRTATNGNGSMGVLPPASPLFPAGYGPHDNVVDAASAMQQTRSYPNPTSNATAAPPSPSMTYLQSPQTAGGAGVSAQQGYGGMYQASYGAAAGYTTDPQMSPSSSPQQAPSWGERSMHQQLYQQSPQLQPQGIHAPYPLPRNNTNHRTKSFDEMLPPAAASAGAAAAAAAAAANEQNQEGYPPFASQAAAAAASTINGSSNTPTLFAQQWGYPPSPHLDYSTPQQHHQLSMPQMLGQNYSAAGSQQHNNRGPHMHKYQPASPYYHTATTPGPPIQTTACNKGPDGANLFIFHIPNHFTNLDMYHLFCKYGTLLSVRIMVEKDTGRSRGFGFVSYDSPESAALAIKELNGFVIGNKRLKVQHKQIRATDHSTPSHHQSSSYPSDSRDNSNWYNAPQSSNQNDDKDKDDSTNTKNIEGTGATTEEGLDENSKRQVNTLPTGRKDKRGGGGGSGGTAEGGLSQLNVLRDALPDLPK
mmetsp:Transcript_19836/g.24460  ORF Transcript_19836/g.24460 Transcript_19836/m.24460 type:complete len:635 (+) Transcript_19836:422-2326(+)|eukprot:CAMPEP_0172509090 /NCGR_PEP_ID=MMETSP1066-20121228/217451_1 /TAXON_ID=671091 /ORGANISM="Coscinodiscus wailesii, Strain CCMP2513" /LENGTH=634 /DNA_ID=CAMNT_0013287413 /DNA_START=406 /DNA_END=2310 /DNA_ORIENTATION=+